MIPIDPNTWERKQLAEKYSDYLFPYLNIGTELDVTGLYRYVKERDLSFYAAVMHLVTRAALEIKNFSYRLVDGAPMLCERLDPDFTHMAPGSTDYMVLHGEYCDDLETFCVRTRELMQRAEESAEEKSVSYESSREVLYLSCIPWVKYTHVVRTIKDPNTENVPRITWGKYEQDAQGRLKMPISLQIHHALMDGYHVGMYLQRLQEMLDEFPS